MSLVENLLRARRRQCEERRRYLAELEGLAERLRADAQRLRAAIDGSGDRLPDRLPDRRAEALTVRQAVLRHATVERSVAAIEIQIGSAAAALALAEAELRQSLRAALQHAGAQPDGAEEAAEARRRRRGRRGASPRPPGLIDDRGG